MLDGKKFDVEHLLSLYAVDCVSLPAEGIYQSERLKEFEHLTKKCHIYIVGFVPRINFTNMTLEGRDLRMTFEILGKSYDILWDIQEDGHNLVQTNGEWHLFKGDVEAGLPPLDKCAIRLNAQYQTGKFLVKYMGRPMARTAPATRSTAC